MCMANDDEWAEQSRGKRDEIKERRNGKRKMRKRKKEERESNWPLPPTSLRFLSIFSTLG